ncbi:MAG TPA: protein kinase [Kofleriaceae bacterium]|jgi:hypothetical protein|nr:protein kinase [Kofleriaceae bacterium]
MSADGTTACLDDDAIVELLEGQLGAAARRAVLRHLDGCSDCRRLVADAGSLGDTTDDELLGRGAAIGRYILSRVVGVGAMGVVYAAHDPQLGREVAVKLLRRDFIGNAEDAQAGMLREARTLARLSHPNVIPIYDADIHGGLVYIVMELVDGRTLREWATGARHTWPELRDVFVQAGRGLQAAHHAGVVHRDFKPDNVLVGRDGRVRVTDFGLARSGPAARGLQTAGMLVGTPAYMSPEQQAGQSVDARSDLYSFCVALHEAVYGVRPAAEPADAPVAKAWAAPSRPPAATVHRVPPRTRRAIEHGLRPAPDERPQSMAALLAELAHQPVVTPRRALVAATLAAALVASGFALRGRGDEGCTGAAVAWGPLWSEAQRGAVRAAFRRTNLPKVEQNFAEADQAMARYRGHWIDLHSQTCRATRRGEQSAAVLDRRMACLATRRTAADDLIQSFGNAPNYDFLVTEAASMIRQLPPLEDCRQARADDQVSTRLVPASSPFALRDHDGMIQVFVIGGDRRPWRLAQVATTDHLAWGSWLPLADPIEVRQLAGFTDQGGGLSVIGIDPAGQLQGVYQHLGNSWDQSYWSRYGIDTALRAATARDGSDHNHLFAVSHGALFELVQVAPNSGWGDWTRLAGGAPSEVAAVADRDGRVHAFTIASGRAWHVSRDAATPIGDRADLHGLAAAMDLDGRLEIVALDAAGRAFRTADTAPRSDEWAAWTPLGTPEALRAVQLTDKPAKRGLQAFGVTTSGRMVTLWQDRTGTEWNKWWEQVALDPGMGAGVSELALQHDAADHPFVFAVTVKGELWLRWFEGGIWHGWLML